MLTWVHERPRPLPDVEEYASSHACCLAPYAIHRIHWPRLLTALVYGRSDLPFVYPTSNIVLRQWNLQEDPYRPAGTPKRRSVVDHIRCSDPAHDVAFGEMLRFGQWLRQYQPEVELHRVPHIPLGGDFLLRVGSSSQDPTFFIEHKAHNSDMFGLDGGKHWDGLSGPKCQHLLLHQPPGQERVRFLARGRTISRWFLFIQNDAYDFVRTILAGYDKMALTRSITLAHFDPLACQTMSTGSPLDLSDGGSSMSIESTLDLLDGRSLTGPHTPQSFPLSTPRPGQKKRRPFGTRINAHAIQLWRYINNDPDNHNYSLVCILLDAAQHHPWAPLAVIPHLWTTKERLAFRTRQQVPVEWEDVLEKQLLGTRCVLLQTVTCTPGPHNTFDSIPIGQCYAVPHALPVTPQRFILLGWSANRTLMELTRIFMVPSDFLSLPSGAEKQQADNANRIAHGQQQASSTPLYMPSRSLWNWPDRIQDHCTASQYWIRLPNVIAHLGELLSPSLPTMRIVHAEEDTAHPNRTFSKHDYQITLGAVLQAQVDLGPLFGPLKARELPDST